MSKFFVFFLLSFISLFGFDPSQISAVVSNVSNDKCDIYVGNLAIGQSGVVVHHYTPSHSVILAKVVVKSSSPNKSVVQIVYDDILKQSALPNVKRKVQNGDVVILNHLYSNAIIVAQNFDAYKKSSDMLQNFNLQNPDILGAHFKIINTPVPTQKDFQNFALAQNIGLIVFVFNQKAHIVDVNSFKIIDTVDITYDAKESFSPFFTNIEEIKRSLYDFGAESIKDFDVYYDKLLKEAK